MFAFLLPGPVGNLLAIVSARPKEVEPPALRFRPTTHAIPVAVPGERTNSAAALNGTKLAGR